MSTPKNTSPPTPDWRAAERDLREAYGAHRFALRRQLQQVQQAAQAGKPFDRNWQRLQAEFEASRGLRQQRRQSVPAIEYESVLPVVERKDEIAAAIREHQVVVVCGETGSGKSTQLPKICLELGRGVDGLIGHTQPRRIAARSVAARIAQELKVSLGQQVGYKIRFNDVAQPTTLIKLMTDGILLAESQTDRFLNQYDTIIIDEAHERSLNIDFLIGYLKQLLPKRRDLKVIITSATIDAERFAEHFGSTQGPAPIITVSGRTYPVDVWYRPLITDDPEEEPDYQQGVVRAVEELCRETTGDILIFQPTEHEIHECVKLLKGRDLPGDSQSQQTELLPLYARLATLEQNRVFQPHPHRRIVIATNVAESSLTVPGIHSVIDTGTVRMSRYSPRSKLQRLPIEPISQASADQRKGRCGRIGPGICIRLYSQQDYETRDRYTAPEIQRTDLSSAILRIKALGFGEIEQFPFLDPPKTEAIRDGYKTLVELGALTEDNHFTEIGKRLHQLPVDPRMARIILAGDAENCLHEILIIAAGLEIQDPRERPVDKQQAADQLHARFVVEDSDFLGYLKLWDFYHQLREQLSRNRLRTACRENFLSYNRLREWLDLHRQLLDTVQRAGLKLQTRRNDEGAIHRALLTGLLSNIAQKGETAEYTVGGGGKLLLWPGSAAAKKKPKWIVCAEQIETSRRFLRTVTRIDPAWIEPLAGHLLKRTYSEPHWDREAETVMAFERVSLFGLIIVPRRRVRYGPPEPALAREIFIRDALATGEFDSKAPFWQHNQAFLAEWAELQTKTRRRDLVLGEEALINFYDQKLPPDVWDNRSLDRWRRQAEHKDPQYLFLQPSDLLLPEAGSIDTADYPDELATANLKLPLEYHFDPSSAVDGVTLVVPQVGLNQLDARRLGWLIPGLLEEKIHALLKGLPKDVRRLIVPLPDTAREVYRRLAYGEGDLHAQVATILREITREAIDPQWLAQAELPSHLRLHVKVIDQQGEMLATGQDLEQLRQNLGKTAAREFSSGADPRWKQTGLTKWTCGDLPEQVTVEQGGVPWVGYPALHDDGSSVSLMLCDTPERALLEMHGGLLRLCVLNAGREARQQINWLPGLEQMLLQAVTLPGMTDFKGQLFELMLERACLTQQPWPRTAEQFDQFLKQGRLRVGAAVQELLLTIPALLKEFHAARRAIEELRAPAFAAVRNDLIRQVTELVAPGFLSQTPWVWLQQYPRYFQSIQARIRKLPAGGMAREQKALLEILPRWQAWWQRREAHRERGWVDPQLIAYRWWLEEFRVSLFSQELRTAVPVSVKRLDELWAKTRAV